MSDSNVWPLRHFDVDPEATAQRVLEWCAETGLQPGYTEVNGVEVVRTDHAGLSVPEERPVSLPAWVEKSIRRIGQ